MDPQQQPVNPHQPNQTTPLYTAPAQFSSPRNNSSSYLIGAIVLAVLLVASLGFGVWSFMRYSDQKNNVDAIAEERVQAALGVQKTELEAEFTSFSERAVNTYTSPSELGSVSFKYPRDWSIYLGTASNSKPLTLYGDPATVREAAVAHGIRLEVIDERYSEVLGDYQRDIEDGALRSSVFKASGQTGVRLDGEIEKDLQGKIVLLPLRDQTIMFWTESNQFTNVYEQALKTLTFTP